jgi:hypothetical protein
VEERFEQQNLELFDPTAQELYRLLSATISHVLELKMNGNQFKTGNMGGGGVSVHWLE